MGWLLCPTHSAELYKRINRTPPWQKPEPPNTEANEKARLQAEIDRLTYYLEGIADTDTDRGCYCRWFVGVAKQALKPGRNPLAKPLLIRTAGYPGEDPTCT